MMPLQAEGKARCLRIADAGDGRAAFHLSRRMGSWVAARGLRALLIVGSPAADACGARSLAGVAPHLMHLDDDALRGCLVAEGQGSFGIVRGDVPVAAALLARLARAYDLLLVALGGRGPSPGADSLPASPALVVALGSERGGLAAAEKFVDRLLEEGSRSHPMAFVLGGADAVVGAQCAARWGLPFWGGVEDVGHIAERALDCTVPLCAAISEAAVLKGEEKNLSESSPPSAPPRDDVVSEVLCRLRAERPFREIRLAPGDREARQELRAQVASAARRILGTIDPAGGTGAEGDAIVARVIDDAVGFGPLEPLLSDAEVTEIMVNGPGRIYVERGGRVERTPLAFSDCGQLMAVIERMVAETGRRVDESSPMVDGRLPDGSRLNVVIPPLAIDGPAVTVRKFARRMRGMEAAVASGMLPAPAARFLAACVRARASLLVSGGTGAGKTTLLGILAGTIDPRERIVTIEDAAELLLEAPHVVRLEGRPPNIEGNGAVTIRDLVRNALRMRPDRIIVGEVRGPEALDMLQAMNTGHEGSLTTVHANAPRDAIARLETMVLMAGMELPLLAVREQIVRAIRLIVQVARAGDGVRRVVEIAEVVGMEGATPCLQTLALLSEGGTLVSTGLAPRFVEQRGKGGEQIPAM